MQTHTAEVVILAQEGTAWSCLTSNLLVLGKLAFEFWTTESF
jgi:hypothetical protein